MSEPGYLLVKVAGDWISHTAARLPELAGIESVRVLPLPGAIMDDTTRQALADGIQAGLACYGVDPQAWRGAEPRDLAAHLARWGGDEAAAAGSAAPPPCPLPLCDWETRRLTELSEAVPDSCTGGDMRHERGSAYCDDHGGDVPELLTEALSTAGNFDDYRDCDRAAAYLYAGSAELRAAVAAFVKAGRIDDDCYEALEAAVLAAARKALAS